MCTWLSGPELTHCTASLESKDKRGDRKKKGEEVRKGEWKRRILHTSNKTKRRERDYGDGALALLNHLKPLMNL